MKKILVTIFIFLSVFSLAQEKKFKVVLDAGHGGKDPGAAKNGCIEKLIALDVVLRIGKILESYPDFNIKYTRKTDVFIPLRDRAKIANDFEADLFVSVHCNSSVSPKPYGAMTLVMGLSRAGMNFEIAKAENAVISLEDNFKEKYEGFDPNNPNTQIGLRIMQEETLLQSINFASGVQSYFKNSLDRKDLGMHQQPLWVLDATVMPGVLIELGFLSNLEESKYMKSEEGKSNYSQIIARSIIEYKNNVKGTNTPLNVLQIKEPVIVEEPPFMETVVDTIKVDDLAPEPFIPSELVYKVQISYSTKKLELTPENFNGLANVNRIEVNGGYKYYYGQGTLEACKKFLTEAKLKGFKTAFIVTPN
ncbi:N-acetylmuramoyl-L-alanine amidase [Flavobacterium sp.]|jgi:N-acetylmuramoyl-L-alanine amidase|uniref:N-acetylmuramoyl-L-alanine amidase n=1 Tax=Flavobacterium sp. TaxID=239 RepID=UPI0037BE3222